MGRSKLMIAAAAAGALVVAVFAASCSRGESVADDTPVLFQWQDYVVAPLLSDYQAAFGVEPETSIFADEDEAFSKMRAGYKPDVMGPCAYEFPRWQEAGLLQPIDTGKLKNWNKIAPALRSLPDIA